MPKGKAGCFVCGAPSAGVLQLWMRRFTGKKLKSGNKAQKTARSRNVTLCTTHLDGLFDQFSEMLDDVPDREPIEAIASRIRAAQENPK